MKVKVYKVTLRPEGQSPTHYFVDAPSKRIARWCGANLFNNDYTAFATAKDVKATRFKLKGN